MQRNFLLCRYIWQLMYVMESKIIQPFLKSMCPAPKSCHPSQCSATCNLFCLRVSHYVSARINCIVRFSGVPATAPTFAEGRASDAASVFKGIRPWVGFILFLVFPFIFFGGAPLGAAPRLPRRTRPGCLRRGGRLSGLVTRGSAEAPGRAAVGTWLPSRPSSRDQKRGARSLFPCLALSRCAAGGRWEALCPALGPPT